MGRLPQGIWVRSVVVSLAASAAALLWASQADAATAVAGDGPFGVAMGQSIKSLGPTQALDAGEYVVLHVPRPNAHFVSVHVVAFPDIGVCKIMGIGPDLVGDADGARVRADVDAIAAALTTKYGAPQKEDDCIDPAMPAGQSITCNDFWPQALQAGKARYIYQWDLPTPVAGVTRVGLNAVAKSALETHSIVAYYGVNRDRCAEETKAADAGSL